MFLLTWYREWLNIRAEFKQRKFELNHDIQDQEKVCASCETLKHQLEVANYEKERLLNRILEKPEPTPERTEAPKPVTRPVAIPWAVRKQMLEQADREKARALRNAPKPDADTDKADVTALEKELNVAESEREAQTADSRRTQ